MKKILFIIISFMVLLVSNTFASDVDVILSWDKPDDSRVTGYYVFMGLKGTDKNTWSSHTINNPDITTYKFIGLEFTTEYEFTAKSYDINNNTSIFAETIEYKTPDEPVQVVYEDLKPPKRFKVTVEINVTELEE